MMHVLVIIQFDKHPVIIKSNTIIKYICIISHLKRNKKEM